MLELTGVASVLRGISILYWLVAAAALTAVLWRIKSWRGKTVGAIVVVAVFGFMPIKGYVDAKKRQDYAREAWAYFKKLCAEKSGEKIYKRFSGVKSVLIVKPLPPAVEKDLYDQYWYGDPYSNVSATTKRSEEVATTLLTINYTNGRREKGFEFVEIKYDDQKPNVVRITSDSRFPFRAVAEVEMPVSRFAVSWEDTSNVDDRKYWIAESRLRVFDLTDASLVAERVGVFIEAGFGSQAGARRPWLTSRGPTTTCPSIRNGDFEDRWFIFKAISPLEEMVDAK